MAVHGPDDPPPHLLSAQAPVPPHIYTGMSINQPRTQSGRFDVVPGKEPVGIDLAPRRYTTSVAQTAFSDPDEILARDAGPGFSKIRFEGPDPDSSWPDERDLVSFEATPAAVAEYIEEYELDEDAVVPVPPKQPYKPQPARSELGFPALLPEA